MTKTIDKAVKEFEEAVVKAVESSNKMQRELTEKPINPYGVGVMDVTEKPMDWEERFDKANIGCCNAGDCFGDHNKELKSLIKDLLKEEREAYEDTIQILQEPETMKKIRQTRIKVAKSEAIAEYKQKLIQRIEGMKKDTSAKDWGKSGGMACPACATCGQTDKCICETYNQTLDEVEAVIKDL